MRFTWLGSGWVQKKLLHWVINIMLVQFFSFLFAKKVVVCGTVRKVAAF